MLATSAFGDLLHPAVVHSRAEVLVPSAAGLYAWYFDEPVPGVPQDGCHVTDYGTLLYVGISPGPPPRNGKAPSTQNLYKRVRYQYTGNAEGSTLWLTLGCHLAHFPSGWLVTRGSPSSSTPRRGRLNRPSCPLARCRGISTSTQPSRTTRSTERSEPNTKRQPDHYRHGPRHRGRAGLNQVVRN